MLGQKSLAPKMALLFNIPLIFYGENEAEYGNPVADNTSAVRDWKYFASNDPSEVYLGGVSIKDLEEKYGVQKGELAPYLPADPAAVQKLGAEVHYLGYYVKWRPQDAFYYASEHGGFQPSPSARPAPIASTTR
jgi:hypothetical protein